MSAPDVNHRYLNSIVNCMYKVLTKFQWLVGESNCYKYHSIHCSVWPLGRVHDSGVLSSIRHVVIVYVRHAGMLGMTRNGCHYRCAKQPTRRDHHSDSQSWACTQLYAQSTLFQYCLSTVHKCNVLILDGSKIYRPTSLLRSQDSDWHLSYWFHIFRSKTNMFNTILPNSLTTQ